MNGERRKQQRKEPIQIRSFGYAGDVGWSLRAIDVLVASQLRQERQHQEGNNMAQASQIGVLGVEDGAGSGLLKNFMALHSPVFRGGTDVKEAKNWLLSAKKHLRSMGCAESDFI